MENKMYSLMVIIASLILSYFSITWLYSDITTVFTLYDNDLTVNWWLYLPLNFFYIFIFFISAILFFTHIRNLNLKTIYKDSKLKLVLKISIILNILIVVLSIFNNYLFHIENTNFIKVFIILILFLCYIICVRKQKIHPFYYLFSIALISFLIWYPIFLFF